MRIHTTILALLLGVAAGFACDLPMDPDNAGAGDGARSCGVSGNQEICCSNGICCTNDSGNKKYWCKIHKPWTPFP